jgi:hypothetical protein
MHKPALLDLRKKEYTGQKVVLLASSVFHKVTNETITSKAKSHIFLDLHLVGGV